MSIPEKIDWFTQKPGSADCGAVAILNAKLWLGQKVKPSELPLLVRNLGISVENNGISGSSLNRWISQKRNFGVDRIVQPNLSFVQSLLKNGKGFILRYIWEVGNSTGAHYVFVCPDSKAQPLVTNPHRISKQLKYLQWRYFSPVEFKKCFSKQQKGNRHYPWIWPIDPIRGLTD